MQQHSRYFVFQNSKTIIVYKHASLHINTISSLVASVAFRYSWNSQIIMTGKTNNSFNIRQLVIFHSVNRKSYRQIAAMLNLSKSTVEGIIKRFKQEDRIESIPQKGQPRKLDVTDQRKITRKIKVNPSLSAAKLADELLIEIEEGTSPKNTQSTEKRWSQRKSCSKKAICKGGK